MRSANDGAATRALRPSVSVYVTEQLLELIRADELRAGSRLPSVASLARSLSVAAPTVRESLRGLEALGIVEIRHGRGVYVRNPESRVLVANPYSGQLGTRTILELLDARLVIEPTRPGPPSTRPPRRSSSSASCSRTRRSCSRATTRCCTA